MALLSISPERIIVGTVTYGDRLPHLSAMMAQAAANGIRSFLVFANGLSPKLLSELRGHQALEHDLNIEILASPTNLGPAPAYARLVEHVRDRIESYDGVLFLDDDNLLQPGALTALAIACAQTGGAVCAVRADRSYMVEAARRGTMDDPLPGEAYGSDLRRTPLRLFRRLTRARSTPGTGAPVPITRAPYGGLLVPRWQLNAIKPPRADFVIYADDYEYAGRLAAHGGLHLVPGAVVEDAEMSWNATPSDAQSSSRRASSSAARLAAANPDFRVYYALRNALVLDEERARAAGASAWFALNRAILKRGVHARARGPARAQIRNVVEAAMRDAANRRLGYNPDYPLPL